MSKGKSKPVVALASLVMGLLALPAVVFINAALGVALLVLAVYLIFAAG